MWLSASHVKCKKECMEPEASRTMAAWGGCRSAYAKITVSEGDVLRIINLPILSIISQSSAYTDDVTVAHPITLTTIITMKWYCQTPYYADWLTDWLTGNWLTVSCTGTVIWWFTDLYSDWLTYSCTRTHDLLHVKYSTIFYVACIFTTLLFQICTIASRTCEEEIVPERFIDDFRTQQKWNTHI